MRQDAESGNLSGYIISTNYNSVYTIIYTCLLIQGVNNADFISPSISVFQAIYLYHQTEAELRIRLSSYLKMNAPRQIALVLKNALNFDVAITDEVRLVTLADFLTNM